MGRGDRRRIRWGSIRQRKKKARERRKSEAKSEEKREARKG